MDTFVKYLFIYQYCIFTYFHLIMQKHVYKTRKRLFLIFTILLSFLTCLFRKNIPAISDILPVTILWVFLCSLTSTPKISYIATILSFGISYGIFVVSSSLILLLFTPIYYQTDHFPYVYFMIPAGALGILLLFCLFKVKRFKNGMTFLYSTQAANCGMGICLFYMLVLAYMHSDSDPALELTIILPLLLLSLTMFLIYWWQSQLTKSYRRKLQALELESLRNELQEKSLLLETLQLENAELSRLIHKDNKLIPAMEHAVYEYLQSAPSDQADGLAKGNLLLEELHHLSENRHDILSHFTPLKTKSFSTDIIPLDALLNYMNKKIVSLNGNFTVNISQSALSLLSGIMTVDDLVHLLADLIENAAISLSNCPSRDIRLQIYQYGKCPILELSDTGIPFEIPALTSLGIKAVTTHAETGGSGIGLMDIWEIKNRYRASLHIIEYESASPFQKKISLLFDHKNQYLLYTWRDHVIRPFVQRIDMHVLANNVNTD